MFFFLVLSEKFVSHVENLNKDSLVFEGDVQLMLTIASNEKEYAVAEWMAEV